MKKIYLSFAVIGLMSINAMAQNTSVVKAQAKKDNTLFKGDMKSRQNTANAMEAKAPGDIIWSNNFTNATKWVATALTATQGAEFGWQISPAATGATSIGTWAFANGRITSTSGGAYAIVKNGNPNVNPATHVPDAQFIMKYDSIFDLSTYPSVDFRFQQYGALFVDKQVVEATVDGTNWVELGNNDDMGALTASGGSAYPNPTTRTYSVNSAFPAGTDFSSVQFRFRVYWPNAGANSGIMYGWFVDDVKLIEGQENDLIMYQTFSQYGSQGLSVSKVPSTQAAAGNISFGAIIKNNGSATQPTTLTVTDGTYSQTSASTDIVGFTRDSLAILTANGYTIPATVGTHTFTFTANSTNTLDQTGDDSKTAKLEITNDVMAADYFDGTAASLTGGFFGWANGTGDAEIGTYFEIFNNTSVGAIQLGIANVNTTADYEGLTVYAKIYEIDQAGDPQLLDATLEHTMVASDFGSIIKTYFTSPVQLEAGKTYLATGAMFLGAEVPIGFGGFVAAGNVAGFNGSTYNGLAPNDLYLNVVECPIVRLDFKDYTGISELENTFAVSAYPNPFTNSTDVSFELANETSVSVQVTDLTGRVVMTVSPKTFSAGANKLTVDASGLNSGVYNYAITIGNQVITKRMIKN